MMGCLAGLDPGAVAQDLGMALLEGRIYLQTSAASPAPAATAGTVFIAQVPGIGGPPLAPGAQLTLPSGTTKSLAYESDDTFRFTATADSVAALAAAYPAGTYHLAYQGGALGNLGTDVSLPSATFPGAVQVTNFEATQAVDVGTDFEFQVKLPAGATGDDSLSIEVRSGNTSVHADSTSGDQTSLILPSDTLAAGQSYEVRIRFSHLTIDSTGILPATVGFFSETRLTLKAVTGSGPVDTTPPRLVSVYPVDGAINIPAASQVLFEFSEPMDPTRVSITWVPALDPAKLTTRWMSENTTLLCTYEGGFPGGPLTWMLNAEAGAAANFRDVAGNEVSARAFHGAFIVVGTDGSGCGGSDPVSKAAFGLLKLVNHRQSDAGQPVNETTNGALVQAFCKIPNAVGRAAIEFPADPAPKPHQLKFFSQFIGTELFFQEFPARADLDAAYPAGDYDFQLRDRGAPTTVLAHVVLSLLANGYPAAPHFSGFAAAQSIDTNADFTLSWDAFANASAAADGLSLLIEDAEGNTVLSLPDPCAGRELPVTATSAVIPRGLLLGGGSNYVAVLTFMKANDHGKTMPGTRAEGFAAIGRATRMPLRTRASAVTPATAPVLRDPRLTESGDGLRVTVEFPAGHPLVLESTSSPGVPFATLLSTNPPASPVTLTIPLGAGGSHALIRARAD